MTIRQEQCSDCDRKHHDPIQREWTEELPSLSPPECGLLVQSEGRRLLDKYGLEEWRIEIGPKTKQWLGQCDRLRKSIDISQCFIDAAPTLDILQDLILHEIAHALTSGGHNFEWKRKYAELLAHHFDASKVTEFLDNDRYCRKHMTRLLSELYCTSESRHVGPSNK